MKQEETYKKILQTIPDIVYEIDLDGKFTYLNDSIVKLGFEPMDLLGKHFSTIVHPDDLHTVQRSTVLPNYSGGGTGDHVSPQLFDERRTGSRITKNLRVRLQKRENTEPPDYCECEVISMGLQSMDRAQTRHTGSLGIIRDPVATQQTELKLIQLEKYYRILLENSCDLISIITNDGTILYISESAKKILHSIPYELIGENIFDYIHHDDTPLLIDTVEQALNKSPHQAYETIYRMQDKDGNWKILESSIKKINETICYIVNSKDITKQITAERELKISEEKYRDLYDKALVGMITLDYSTGRVSACNELGFVTFGYNNRDEFIGIDFFKNHMSQRQFSHLYKTMTTDNDIVNDDIQFSKKDKTQFWASVTVKKYDVKSSLDMVIVDITKSKNTEKQVYELTFFDQLTKLPNKNLFYYRIQTEIMKGHRFAIMCIGIHNFKNINEMYGPSLGDILLQHIAKNLNDVYFKKDMVSRFAGDKFMILLPTIGGDGDEINVDNISIIAHKTIRIFSTPFQIEGYAIELTPHIGICLYPDDGKNPEELMRNSESAMYAARDIGKSLFHYFDASLNNLMKERITLEARIRKAIKANEFEPFFQAKVDNDGRIIGMEALIRWKPGNSKSFIPPDKFIPIAERNRTIIDIGYLILEKSCRQTKTWLDAGYPPLRVAVNLSPFQFSHPDLITNIISILQKIGLDAKWLELEITETGIMENENDTIEKLNQLHEMGISISIDDFGIGYSSLSKLKNYPIDTLKIDKSFIEDLPYNKQAKTLVTTIIDLAHNLRFKVVAEGVETVEQYRFLKELSCNYFQGYYFYKPLPADAFTKLLSS